MGWCPRPRRSSAIVASTPCSPPLPSTSHSERHASSGFRWKRGPVPPAEVVCVGDPIVHADAIANSPVSFSRQAVSSSPRAIGAPRSDHPRILEAALADNGDLPLLDFFPADHVKACHHCCLMARTWLSIRVELVEGGGANCWPRPPGTSSPRRNRTPSGVGRGDRRRIARWDRGHLHDFGLADGTRLSDPDPDWDEPGELDDGSAALSRLKQGDQFVYTFDLGDGWAHLSRSETRGSTRLMSSASCLRRR